MKSFVFLCIFSFLLSQGGIKGKVTDGSGDGALAGVNILIVGTTLGTSTDLDGKYSLKLDAGEYKVRYMFTGYKTETVTLSVNNTFITNDVVLKEDLLGLSEVVVLGTRTSDERTVVNSPIPIDIISAQDIKASGFTQATQILKMLIPSFNAPQPSISDGTDHIRPATLRGLGPDQVLVLINGKRRHTTALIHVNGTVGRGATGVDLNAIPVSAIDRIEVLRDGAAAQYGSDAIAGVINIILKNTEGTDVSFSYGQYFSKTKTGYTPEDGNRVGETSNFAAGTWDGLRYDDVSKNKDVSYNDGQTISMHLGHGIKMSDGAYYFSMQLKLKDPTNRAGEDPRQQFTGSNASSASEINFDRVNHKFGDSKLNDFSTFLNGTTKVGDGLTMYNFGGYSYRTGKSAGFYRRSLDARNDVTIYPNGFLPHIETKVSDFSFVSGIKGSLTDDMTFDVSGVFGGNKLIYSVTNSLNRSFGSASQTSFDAGALAFNQLTLNADFHTNSDIGSEKLLEIGFGAEFRSENYEITAGETQSWETGPVAGVAAGSQVFPGFKPSNAGTNNRTSEALYLDLENQFTSDLLFSGALRFENFSDFGSTFIYKFAGKLNLTEELALRGATNSGFRAPSLAQSFYTATSTNFIGGVPFDIGTFSTASPVGKLLGAKDLKAEKSNNYSLGFTVNLDNLSITTDAYRIDIKDRIVLTENFTDVAVRNFLAAQGYSGLGGGRFFTNAIDTKTEGIDLTLKYGLPLDNGMKLKFILAANFTKTVITNDSIKTPPELKAYSTTPIISRIEIGRFELGQPRSTINFMTTLSTEVYDAMLRFVKYGDVTNYNSNTDFTADQTFQSKIITDLEFTIKMENDISASLGFNNLFDVYPDKQLKVNSTSGILQYSGLSPWGFNGRFVYVRASIKL